jgi:hypothetical protein
MSRAAIAAMTLGGGREAENERPRGMLYVIDDVLVARHESAQRCEALGKGSHREIDLFREAEVGGGPAPAPEDSQ